MPEPDPAAFEALHPQVRSLLEGGSGPGIDESPDLAALRAGYLDTALRLGGPQEVVADVEDVVVPREDSGRVSARVYRPLHPAPGMAGAIVWLHGGGWLMGDLEGFDRVCRSLANAAGHAVVSVDYRLAPECPFPAAVEDAAAALRWARDRGAGQGGWSAEHVVVGGDSAGGNLAAVAALRARGDGLAAVRAQLLVYPALDDAMESGAYREFAAGPMLSAAEMERCWALYRGEAEPGHPDLAPLRGADLAGAPPAFVAVAGIDPLRDDGLRYAEALRAAGVQAEVEVFEDMTHGFLRWGGVVDRARELVAALGAYARDSLS